MYYHKIYRTLLSMEMGCWTLKNSELMAMVAAKKKSTLMEKKVVSSSMVVLAFASFLAKATTKPSTGKKRSLNPLPKKKVSLGQQTIIPKQVKKLVQKGQCQVLNPSMS
ncbi:hypothetical protein DVH24_002162 [Malus domestica]|uniref:Uncharacterized protein n=1 Tax=Malus domestica TaxID=3750 RepID=A0A498I8Y2_MALDO|nr:hypothetical protein DVH24_002162 [Malus domestica]